MIYISNNRSKLSAFFTTKKDKFSEIVLFHCAKFDITKYALEKTR